MLSFSSYESIQIMTTNVAGALYYKKQVAARINLLYVL